MRKDQIGEYKHIIPTLCCLMLAGVSAWFRTPQVPRPLVLQDVFASVVAALPLGIAFLAARSYMIQRSRIFLLFGSGMIMQIHPDVVLIDIDLSGGRGLEIIRQAHRQREKHLPVIIAIANSASLTAGVRRQG